MVWNYDPTAIANVPIQPSDLTPRLRQDLICIFLQNREMCYFDLHVGRFIASLSLPPADPQAPHPTLVNAILLVGCYFSRDLSLAGYENGLLAAANNSLSTSFHHTDRLHDFVRASNLIAFYYFCKGLYVEAYQQIITSCRMTITCGLHQISSSAWPPMGTNDGSDQLLSYPVDAVEHGERIQTFWQTFCLDKMISMVVGRPAHLLGGLNADPQLQISTPWPRLLSDYENGTVFDLDRNSVTNLYMNQMSTVPGRLETLASLRSQGYALVYKTVHLLANRPTPQEIFVTDSAIKAFTSRLPHLMNSGDCGEIPATPGLSPINYKIVTIHTLAHVASLILHQHGTGESARRRCSNAAQGIAAIIGKLNDGDCYSELFIDLGHLWYTAGRILLTIPADATRPVVEQNRNWALVIISALKRLSMVYPPLGFQLRQLQRIL